MKFHQKSAATLRSWLLAWNLPSLLQGNSGISKNKGTFFWNFVVTLEFGHDKSIVLLTKLIDG